MKFLIMGRTSSGKDALRSILTKKYNWKFVKSYTTRPKRFPEEDTYLFISQEEADSMLPENKIAPTRSNGYEYYSTPEQIHLNDAYIIDPDGMEIILKTMPHEWFHIVYLSPIDPETQERMAIMRAENPEKEISIFHNRKASEDPQFTRFENQLDNHGFHHDNCVTIHRFVNNYEQKALEDLAASLELTRLFHRNIEAVINDMVKHDIIDHDGNGILIMRPGTEKPVGISAGEITDYLEENDEMLGQLARAWFSMRETDIPTYLTARDVPVDEILEKIGPAVENMLGESDG